MPETIESKIQELVDQYGYDAQLLKDFAEFVIQSHSGKAPSKTKPPSKRPSKAKSLTVSELQSAVAAAFGCSDVKELKKSKNFKLATAGQKPDFRKKETWLVLYREWVGVPENERNEEGPTVINGIDVLKNFRPWHVFELNPKTATSEDINSAFRRLAKQHHPDHGGDGRVFEELKKMRDSLLVGR